MSVEKKIVIKDALRKVVKGEQLILSVGVDHNSFLNEANDNSLHYLWTKDGTPFGNEEGDLAYHDVQHPRSYWDRPTIVLDKIEMEDAGIYQCEITNQFGTVISDPTTVEVLDALNTPLLAKNLVVNGEMRQGDSGWQVIEGSMEQHNMYFWDGFKRKGFASIARMSPKTWKVQSEDKYPPPRNGDRIMGPWTNRSGLNEVRIQQDIDLTGIADVIDRKVEGLTTVDLRVGAWLMGKRFHPSHTNGYIGDHEGKPDWTRATASHGTYGTRVNTFWYLRSTFIEDHIAINYYLYDEHGETMRVIQLTNTPNSYILTLTAFKSRRISLPPGVRKIRVEVVAKRDGNRQKDRHSGTDNLFYKMIQTGAWGINARIIANDIGDDWNKYYRMWQMPSQRRINPAVLNYRWSDDWRFDEWWENQAEGHGIKDDITYKKASWRGIPAWKQYRHNDGSIRMIYKWFNIWRDVPDSTPTYDDAWDEEAIKTQGYDTRLECWQRTTSTWHDGHSKHYYDMAFGKPCGIKDAALADLNVKRMNVHWFRDYNNREMDSTGKSFMPFLFSTPEIPGDIQDLKETMLKRRKLILPAQSDIPLINQSLYMEDIDQIIYDVHAKRETGNFRPHLNLAGGGLAGCWERDDSQSDNGKNWYPNRGIYDPFREICDSDIGISNNYSSWRQFIERPRRNDELEDFYLESFLFQRP